MSDIDIAVADSLKVLDLKRPIREATELRTSLEVRFVPILLQKSVAPMGGRPFRYERPALIGRR